MAPKWWRWKCWVSKKCCLIWLGIDAKMMYLYTVYNMSGYYMKLYIYIVNIWHYVKKTIHILYIYCDISSIIAYSLVLWNSHVSKGNGENPLEDKAPNHPIGSKQPKTWWTSTESFLEMIWKIQLVNFLIQNDKPTRPENYIISSEIYVCYCMVLSPN